MNANMKRLLILALVPVTVWGIGSTFTKQKIDRIGVNTESQITMEDTTRFNSGTASTVPYLDANKDFVSSSVTPTELGYLSGVTSSIQTQIDSKQTSVSGTANEIDVAADIVGLADNPILPGLESVTIPAGADGDRPSSPVNGMIRYNTTSSSFEGYQAGAWGELGGGGGVGGSRLQLISDPSFEEGVTEGSCTGCTATQDTTDKLGTDNNLASLKMAFSAASGDYTLTKSTSAQYSNVAGTVSAWIKTSASDCHFDELVDGTQSQTVAIGSSDEWKQYIINGTTGTTSYGWRVRCDTAITDDVFVDETFAGAAEPDTFDIGTASFQGSVTWDTTTGCLWTLASTSHSNYSADADCDDNARVVRGNYVTTSGDAGNSDGQTPKITFSYIPAGTVKLIARGFFYASATSVECNYVFSDGTNRTVNNVIYHNVSSIGSGNTFSGELHYDKPQTNVTFQIQSRSASSSCNIAVQGDEDELEISVYHYPSPQKVVSAKCDGLECVNEFSAKITSSTGTVENENVDWISSCTTATEPVCTFTSGLFSNTPNCTVTVISGSTTKSSYGVKTINSSSVTLQADQGGFTVTEHSVYMLQCQRAGSDYKQFDQRFIPVNDPQDITVEAYGNGGQSITANSTDVTFNEVVDNQNAWNGSQFTAPKKGVYQVEGSIYGTSLAIRRIDGYINGGAGSPVGARTFSNGDVNSNVHKFSGQVRLNEGDVLSIRVNQTFTLNNANQFHWIAIKKLKEEQKAFIGNLTPKEFVQTPGSTKPVMYSAKIAANGTVSNEIGDWINGNCTNTSPMVCTFNAGTWSSTPPNCTISDVSTANAQFCEFNGDPGTATMSIKCYNYLATDQTTAIEKNVICHGVQ